MVDRAIAGQVWRSVFARDPLSRDAGELYRHELLRHGGGRDPWECVGAVLKDERVSRGDKLSMKLLGQWGLEADESASSL